MPNKIEAALVKATGLKKKVAEPFQKWAERLIAAAHDLSSEDWDSLDDPTQDWVNDGSRAMNKNKDVERFPDDDAGEEPAEEEKPRGRRGRDAEPEAEPEEEEKPRGRRGRDAEPEEEEEKPRGRGRRAEPEEEPEEEKPRGRGRSKDAEPEEEKPRGRRSREPEPEEEPKPRGRGRAAKEEPKPRNRTRARGGDAEADDKSKQRGKPAAKRGDDGKSPSSTTLLKKMLIKNPSMTTDEILDVLNDKHNLQPTRMAIASIRSAFIHSMRILNDAGLLDEKMAAKL